MRGMRGTLAGFIFPGGSERPYQLGVHNVGV